MNSERPRKPKSDFSPAFDNEEIEINVSYEEITPEEQLKIKQRAQDGVVVDSASEQISDMWLDDEPEIVGSRQQVSDEIEQEEVLKRTEFEVSEPEPVLDDVAKAREQTEKIADNSDDDLIESEPEPVLDNVTTEAREQIIANDLELEDRESEPLLDDVARAREQTDIPNDLEPVLDDVATKPIEQTDIANDTEPEISESEPILDDVATEAREQTDIANGIKTEVSESEPIEEELALDNIDSSPDEIQTSEPREIKNDSTTFIDSEENEPEINNDNSQPELIADSWLDESEIASAEAKQDRANTELRDRELTTQISQLEQQKTTLLQEIEELQAQKAAIAQQIQVVAENLGSMVEEGTRELKERKNNLLVDIEKLERRSERIRQEMRSNFAGASQDLAVRIQGFKEYLVGSLQDLTTAAERLDFPKPEERRPPRRESRPPQESVTRQTSSRDVSSQPQFTEQAFADQTRRIRQLIEKYRTQPDYYGSPWQLRRTFEPIHAQKVQEWFFDRGGRGAIKGMGSRLQNILVASAVISILYRLYRDRCRILVLVDTPEKLGEWRRGLQDCLGISRNDFGTNRGVVLFESADILVQRADRLLEDKLLPLIIIDETEELINLGLLKFPLWLAFAEKPQPKSSGYLY